MKPKTQAQKRMLAIVQSFPELTEKQMDYYKSHCFDSAILESRNRLVCADCGHSWKVKDGDKVEGAKCPHCGKAAKIQHNKAMLKQIEYFIISQHIEGYQVLRFIQVRRRSEKNKVYHWHQDVGAMFIDCQGTRTEFTLSRFSMSWIFDAWSFDSEIELRSKNSDVLYRLGAGAMITKSIMPTLKRNGYDGKLFENDASHLIVHLLTNPEVESWWKIGQKGIVSAYLRSSWTFNEEKRRLARLATRHKRIFSTYTEWSDFIDFISDLRTLNQDIFNPSIIFPEDFETAHHDTHERAQAKRNREYEERERERRLRQNELAFQNAQKDETKKDWINHYQEVFASMDFERQGYRFKPLLTVDDFQAEADAMNHCIRNYYGKQDTLLLSISYGGEKTETAEINLKNAQVMQCRGYDNHPTKHHDTIVFLLKQYMRIFLAYNDGKFLKYAKNKQAVKETAHTEEQKKVA